MKEGKLYCYATAFAESHGFMVKTNREFEYPLEAETEKGFKLHGTNEVYLKPGQVNVFMEDPRLKHIDRMSAFVMIYEAGKTDEEVIELIKPQLAEMLEMRAKVYELMAKNAREMLAACKEGKAEHTCPPGWGE